MVTEWGEMHVVGAGIPPRMASGVTQAQACERLDSFGSWIQAREKGQRKGGVHGAKECALSRMHVFRLVAGAGSAHIPACMHGCAKCQAAVCTCTA